jgi:hypothetical protein
MTPSDSLPMPVDENPARACRRTLLAALVGGLLIAATEFAATFATTDNSAFAELGWLLRLSVHWSLAALPAGIAMTVLERRNAASSASLAGYAFAVLLGAVGGAFVMALHGKYIDPAITATAVGVDMPVADRFLYGFWQLCFWGAAGAVLHATSQRGTRSEIALSNVQLARLHSERSLSELRLAALQARVEPEFLLATLRTVERFCATDPPIADRVLEALIRFLRDASPQLRGHVSSVDQECRLLKNYLRLLEAIRRSPAHAPFEIDPRAATAVMPPGTLLSLAQPLLRTSPGAGPEALLHVRTHASPEAVIIAITVTAAYGLTPPAPRDLAARAEQRLRMTCDPQSSVEVLCDDSRSLTIRLTLISRRETHHE